MNKTKFSTIKRNYLTYYSVHIVLLIFGQFGCNTNERDNSNFVENIQINVNYEYLSTAYTFSDNSTTVCPPKNWIKADSSDVQKINQQIADNVIDVTFEDVFSSKGGSHLIIGKIESDDTRFEYIPNDFIDLLKVQFQVNDIKYHTFYINNILVREYLIDVKDVLIFKNFIYSNNENYQLDYIISKQSYNKDIESVESSIGSLSRKE